MEHSMKSLFLSAAILWCITGYIYVSTQDYEDEVMSSQNWKLVEEITLQEAERNAKRYELEALREALEFTDAPHERRYLQARIKELECYVN